MSFVIYYKYLNQTELSLSKKATILTICLCALQDLFPKCLNSFQQTSSFSLFLTSFYVFQQAMLILKMYTELEMLFLYFFLLLFI